jgi:hypothetical protein
MAMGAFASLVIVAVGPVARADDDIAIINLQEKTLVGNVVLDPGVYFIRAHSSTPNHMVVRVSNVNETKSFALVIAQQVSHSTADAVTTMNYLVSEGSGPSRLRTWEVAGKGITYLFVTNNKVPQLVAGTRTVIPALTASR